MQDLLITNFIEKTEKPLSTSICMSNWKEFQSARTEGHIVKFAWLWSKACKFQNEIDPNIEIKNHVIVYFPQRYQIRMRSKQGAQEGENSKINVMARNI